MSEEAKATEATPAPSAPETSKTDQQILAGESYVADGSAHSVDLGIKDAIRLAMEETGEGGQVSEESGDGKQAQAEAAESKGEKEAGGENRDAVEAVGGDDAKPEADTKSAEAPDGQGGKDEAKQASATAAVSARDRAEVARQKREVDKAQAEIKAQQEKVQAQLNEIQSDPYTYLNKNVPNWYETATKRILNDGKPTEADEAHQTGTKLEQLERKLEETRQMLTQQQQAAQAAQEATKYIDALKEELNTDGFELAREAYDIDDVTQYVTAQAGRTGTVPSQTEALQTLVEDCDIRWGKANALKALLNRPAVREALTELMGDDDFKSSLGLAKPDTASKATTETKGAPKTLSNDMGSSTTVLSEEDLDKMSDHELLQHLSKNLDTSEIMT